MIPTILAPDFAVGCVEPKGACNACATPMPVPLLVSPNRDARRATYNPCCVAKEHEDSVSGGIEVDDVPRGDEERERRGFIRSDLRYPSSIGSYGWAQTICGLRIGFAL